MDLLTKEQKYLFNIITLDYIFKDKGHTFSNSLKPHSIIIEEMVLNNEIKSNENIDKYLKHREIYKILKEITKIGDMCTIICKWGLEIFSDVLIYTPSFLSENEIYFLRLWTDFFKEKKVKFEIYQHEDIFYTENNEIKDFLTKNKVEDDEYIKVLAKKYSTYY